MSSLAYPRRGIRVTVRLNGAVVDQRVLWAPPVGELLSLTMLVGLVAFLLTVIAGNGIVLLEFWTPLVSRLAVILLVPTGIVLALAALLWPRTVELGASGSDAVPTPGGRALATVTWRPGQPPLFVDHTDGDAVIELEDQGAWTWSNGDVEVDVDAQDRLYARRLASDPLGDLGLIVVILSMVVGLNQFYRFQSAMPGRPVAADAGYEVSPELIARLLEKDYDGADEGISERVDRPEHQLEGHGIYLPAGTPGQLTRAGGGDQIGPEVIRTPPPEDLDDPVADLSEPEADDQLAMDSPDDMPALDSPLAAEETIADLIEQQEELARQLASRPQDAMERFIGWGFRDWLDASPSRERLDPDVERNLQFARARLRLDPEDYGALQVVGHYAYLAENHELCRSSYERLLEIFPEDAAGYNNLALTYKRTGEWMEEEALYRKALDIDPMDPIVLNNLAVNLAHQGRFDEALALLTQIDEIDPDDAYSDLHRAKVYAAMGKRDKAYKYLKRALDGVGTLDTLHHIEFRQDLRLEPLLGELRGEERFRRLVERAYGPDGRALADGGRRG